MRIFPAPGRAPDRSRALAQYRGRAAQYDTELLVFEPIRVEAIRLLRLHPGDCVLDVACGTGLSFDRLRRRVGPHGRVIGIEQCPEMISRAEARVAARHWDNVELVEASAADAELHAKADAALFHFTHDVLRDDASLDNIFAHLKPGAHVVATGLQWAPAWAVPVNAFVLSAALYSVTCLEGLEAPWDRLATRLHQFHVEHTLFGGIYVASGNYAGAKH